MFLRLFSLVLFFLGCWSKSTANECHVKQQPLVISNNCTPISLFYEQYKGFSVDINFTDTINHKWTQNHGVNMMVGPNCPIEFATLGDIQPPLFIFLHARAGNDVLEGPSFRLSFDKYTTNVTATDGRSVVQFVDKCEPDVDELNGGRVLNFSVSQTDLQYKMKLTFPPKVYDNQNYSPSTTTSKPIAANESSLIRVVDEKNPWSKKKVVVSSGFLICFGLVVLSSVLGCSWYSDICTNRHSFPRPRYNAMPSCSHHPAIIPSRSTNSQSSNKSKRVKFDPNPTVSTIKVTSFKNRSNGSSTLTSASSIPHSAATLTSVSVLPKSSATEVGEQEKFIEQSTLMKMTERSKSEDSKLDARAALAERKKNRGILGSIGLRIGERVGVIEQTRLAPEFDEQITHYFEYQSTEDDLIGQLEEVLQPNVAIRANGRIESPQNEDPFDVLANSLRNFRHSAPAEQTRMKCAEAIVRRLALDHRTCQRKGRRTLNKSRVFVTKDFSYMTAVNKQLMLARDIMDGARHELKATRTHAEVEEKGRIYEQSVHEFDEQAGQLAAGFERLPRDKEIHQRELLDWFEVQARYHAQAQLVIAHQLKQIGIFLPGA
ncbi:BAR domain-containing protein [Aphelenchoides besseyi]|nr:BAR domain-containing protein [Aphelenchoides besseyi]